MQLWLCPLLAFLLGSIPFGLLIAKAHGIDIRQHGSGNIGATNVLRVIGRKSGIACLLLDVLKGFIPVVIAVNLIRIAGKDVRPRRCHSCAACAMIAAAADQRSRPSCCTSSPACAPCSATTTRHGSVSRAARASPPRPGCCWH